MRRFLEIANEIAYIAIVWYLTVKLLEWVMDAEEVWNPKEFWDWLQTGEGKFAEWLATTQNVNEKGNGPSEETNDD